MAKKATIKQAEDGGVAVLDKPEVKETATAKTATADYIKFWSPESEKLLVQVPSGSVQFKDFQKVLSPDDPLVDELRNSHVNKQDFYEILDKEGDDEYQLAATKFLRKLIEYDERDKVSRERGIRALVELFTASELKEAGISTARIDPELLLLKAQRTKYVEGII